MTYSYSHKSIADIFNYKAVEDSMPIAHRLAAAYACNPEVVSAQRKNEITIVSWLRSNSILFYVFNKERIKLVVGVIRSALTCSPGS